MLKLKLIHCAGIFKATKYGYFAESEVAGEGKVKFFMSDKQGVKFAKTAEKLKNGYSSKNAEMWAIFDDEKEEKKSFVWCGLHTHKRSELDFLLERFKPELVGSSYIGFDKCKFMANEAKEEQEAVLESLKD